MLQEENSCKATIEGHCRVTFERLKESFDCFRESGYVGNKTDIREMETRHGNIFAEGYADRSAGKTGSIAFNYAKQ